MSTITSFKNIYLPLLNITKNTNITKNKNITYNSNITYTATITYKTNITYNEHMHVTIKTNTIEYIMM